MADNIAITAGAGTTVASDDIGGVHYQRVKMVWGVDGTASDANATTPLPVSLTMPATQIHKAVNVTTTQTGTDVWTPGGGLRIAVTSLVIGSYGTTAGRVILWFGDNADTTYTAGTDQVLVAASFAPSATAKPGLVYTPSTPILCTTADRELHLTTDAGISLDITVEGYEW